MSQITLTWTIQNMTRTTDTGFVINVAWACQASAEGCGGAFHGGTTTYENNPSEPGFIPYDQLTQQIVLGWVFDGLGPQKAVIEATLTAKVEAQLNPVTANGVPWNTAPAAA